MRSASFAEKETDEIVLQYIRIVAAVYCIEIFLVKVAILLQYLRVFVPKSRNLMFWACHALIWLHFIFYSISFFLVVFACRPVRKNWNPWIEGSCIDIGLLNVFVSVFNAASDLLILILPQPLIWKLQITLRTKILLSAVFLIGIWWVEDAIFTSSRRAHVDTTQGLRINHYSNLLFTQINTN